MLHYSPPWIGFFFFCLVVFPSQNECFSAVLLAAMDNFVLAFLSQSDGFRATLLAVMDRFFSLFFFLYAVFSAESVP